MSGRGARAAAGWLTVALVIAGQWLLFRSYVEREVAWAYPAYFDQVASLSRSYEIHERIRSGGLFTGVREGLGMTGASGTLFPVEGAMLHRLFGSSRLSALSVGFLHFAAFQVVLVVTLLWLTGRWSLAFLGIGLLLTFKSPLLPMGGLTDFRMDSPAQSLMGIFLCLAIRSRTFAERRWSVVAGAAAALLVALRTLTLVYLVGILGGFGAILLWRGRTSLGPSAGAWRRRWSGLRDAVLVLAVAAVPLVSYKWQRIHDYYVVGHLTGPEKWIHPRLLGLRSASDFLLFYPISFLRDHAGPRFLVAGAAVLTTCGLASRWRTPATAPDPDRYPAFAFTALAFAVPLAVLTADISKSAVVAGILVASALWLVLLNLPRSGRGLQVLSVAVLALGAEAQWSAYSGPGPFASRRRDVEATKELHGLIGESSRVMGWSTPVVTVDRLADFLVPSIVTTEMVERRGTFIKVRFGVWEFGEITEERAIASISRSDFVVLTRSDGELPFPFDASMRKLHPRLEEACQRDHVVLGRFRIQGVEVVAYVRAAVRVEEGPVGSIPAEGLVLRGLGPVLRARPLLELRGPLDLAPDVAPTVVAEGETQDAASWHVPMTFELSGQSYRIRLELPEAALASTSSAVTIRLRVEGSRVRLRNPHDVRLSSRSSITEDR